MKTVCLIVVALALAACGSSNGSGDGPADVDAPHPGSPSSDGVRLGETVRVDGPAVTPLSVVEDSRCPVDVVCVWAGRVRLSVRVDVGSSSEVHELTLGAPIHVADGELELIAVAPDARSHRDISPDDYRFAFRFSGGI